ncbi:MAG TPA: hypothetical protein VGH56_10625, partial [Solirubrobacteraceae bacterium]
MRVALILSSRDDEAQALEGSRAINEAIDLRVRVVYIAAPTWLAPDLPMAWIAAHEQDEAREQLNQAIQWPGISSPIERVTLTEQR